MSSSLESGGNNHHGVNGVTPSQNSGSGSGSGSSNLVIGSKYKPNLRTTLSVDKLSSKYNELIDLILSPDLELVNVICQLTLVKETGQNSNVNVSDILVLFFEIHCNLKSTFLLKWAIDKEIECTNNGPTLFRGLSIATRLISAFYKRIGESYLKYLLQPFILDIVSRNFSFEIDPEKAGKGMNIQNNLEKLITITQQVLDKILDSLNQCPMAIRNILHHTQDRVEKKFPFMKTTVIGGFIFLRFICPAIVAPEIFGLTGESPSTDSRRGLVLVSKLLQNLANEMPFGVGIKEEYMQYLNDFITNNAERIHVFFDKLASSNSTNSSVNSTPLSSSMISQHGGSNGHTNHPNGSANGGTSTSSATALSSNGSDTSPNYNGISTTPSGAITNSPILSKEASKSKLNLPNKEKEINGELQAQYNDELIQGNLNNLVNQIIDNREKIETLLLSENTPESNDLLKKLDSALQSIKQKGISTKLIPWKRTKDNGSSPTRQSSTHGHSKSGKSPHITSPITSSVISNFKESQSANASKSYSDIQEEDIQNSLITSMSDYQSYYRSKLEIKDIELKQCMEEIAFLKKESDDAKFKSNVIKKLRDEVDSEKKKRRDAEIQLQKVMEKLKQIGDVGVEIINELSLSSNGSADQESSISTSDISSLIEDTLEISTPHTSTNSTMKKRKSSNLPPSGKNKTVHSSPTKELTEPSYETSMRRSTTTGTISDVTHSTNSLPESSGSTIVKSESHKNISSGMKSHSRANSNSEYIDSELTSSESNPPYEMESEDRIVQAYVDGELEEDDDGMDLLEFLKEAGENHAKKIASLSVSSVESPNYDSSDKKKKSSGSGIFKLALFSSSKKNKKPTSPVYSQNSSSSSSSIGSNSSRETTSEV